MSHARTHFLVRSRLAIFFAAIASLCPGQTVNPPPKFSEYPFDQWAAAADHASIKWDIRIPSAELSFQQRLIQRVQAIIPGRELERRRGRGALVMLVRIEDSDGRQWRAGSSLSLRDVQAGAKNQEVTFTFAAFMKPGDYRVQIALCDSHTMDHNFVRRVMHVAPLKAEPLPQAWVGLPQVEMLPAVEVPEAWSLPAVKGLLNLPVTAKHPPQIDLLVNMTPSERAFGPAGSLRRNMTEVIPALKVLSGLNAKIRPPTVSVLDLTHQKVAFESSNAASLDWVKLDRALTEHNPGIIDAKSLAAQRSMREYFVDEVFRRAVSSDSGRWLIIMSGSLFFNRQDEMTLPELPPDPGRHIVYFRFSPGAFPAFRIGGVTPPVTSVDIAPIERIHGPLPGRDTVLPARGRGGPGASFPDDLERVLKPMGARVIGITTPEQFRKALAALIDEMSAN